MIYYKALFYLSYFKMSAKFDAICRFEDLKLHLIKLKFIKI